MYSAGTATKPEDVVHWDTITKNSIFLEFMFQLCLISVLPYWFSHANREYKSGASKTQGGYTVVSS